MKKFINEMVKLINRLCYWVNVRHKFGHYKDTDSVSYSDDMMSG